MAFSLKSITVKKLTIALILIAIASAAGIAADGGVAGAGSACGVYTRRRRLTFVAWAETSALSYRLLAFCCTSLGTVRAHPWRTSVKFHGCLLAAAGD